MRADVFETTYRDYLAKLSKQDLLAIKDVLGVEVFQNIVNIDYFTNTYQVSTTGIESEPDDVDFSTKIVLLKYLLHNPSISHKEVDEWGPYRSFRDSAPLINYFAVNVLDRISQSFTNKVAMLKECVARLGGKEQQVEGYDLVAKITALPRVPIMIYFNDQDDLFPTSCSVLFRSSAPFYLDMECLAITGVHLADRLIEKVT